MTHEKANTINDHGTLYIVATPIGNLGDITYRAVETLRDVALIACEDTRVTAKLCERYNIETRRIAIHHHTKDEKLQQVVEQILAGESVAYVSDAGTPGVSDPGNQLVAAAITADVPVIPLPGPSAVGALISIAGCNTQEFLFMAYPPHKKGRQTFFEKVVASEVPVVYYDSVHRVIKNLSLLAEMMPGAEVVVGRELTKLFEEVVRGNVTEVIMHFSEHPDRVKGEFVLLVK